jgi:hypothetical protein
VGLISVAGINRVGKSSRPAGQLCRSTYGVVGQTCTGFLSHLGFDALFTRVPTARVKSIDPGEITDLDASDLF